jgi:hypothetical protein
MVVHSPHSYSIWFEIPSQSWNTGGRNKRDSNREKLVSQTQKYSLPY